MISKAINKYIRRTPRKVNAVLTAIRGKKSRLCIYASKKFKQSC